MPVRIQLKAVTRSRDNNRVSIEAASTFATFCIQSGIGQNMPHGFGNE